MESIWAKSVKRKQFKSLDKDIKTDVLVVGGGLAGILCAYELQKSGINCVLVEANRILCGVTENTTAKITAQHGLIYNDIINKYGVDSAKMYLTAQQDAMKAYAELCKGIDCDYKVQDAYVYTTRDSDKLAREAEAYKRIGLKYELCKTIDLPMELRAL